MRRRGFTLIELLVVIATRDSAAILFPVSCKGAGERSEVELPVEYHSWCRRHDTCRTTMRSSSPGIALGQPGCPLPLTETADGLIGPYVKNIQVFTCPSKADRRSIGFNMIMGFVAQATIQEPADKVLFADDTFGSSVLYRPSQGVSNWGANFVTPEGSTGANIKWGENCPYGRHLDMVNVGFCDGHAKSMKPEVLWANGTNKFYDP